ncbi:unnamed protein product [Phytophthora fragariaefolia]|uniref:Unnamed protein product n=1 Tax=Phytophthora fragariaefolia TaxID=1490495 RepID=A0A9W6WV02_9STRA|nr:unnamed protein product [Phytophthora fragariaefolia]
MRVLTAALVGNPLPEHIKVTVFTNGLRVGPACTQRFRVHTNTMVEAIQIALQEEYSHRQARTPATAWQDNSPPGSGQGGSPGNGATSGPIPMELDLAGQPDTRCFGCGRMGHMKRVYPARGQQKPKGRVQQPRPKSQGYVGRRRRAVRASTDKVLQAAHQVGNLGPPEQGISRREPSVGNVVPGGFRNALIAWEAGDTASNVGNLVHVSRMADNARDEASSDVGNIVPRRDRRRRRRHRTSGQQSQTGVAQGDSEPKAKAPQTRSPDERYHVIDSETGLRVKADAVQLETLPEVAELLNLEDVSLDDFLADLKAGEIAEMVILRPEPIPEELNAVSVMGEDVLEEFRKQRASGLGSEVLKDPKDPVYLLVKDIEDVVSKDSPSQLPPDRDIRRKVLCHKAMASATRAV